VFTYRASLLCFLTFLACGCSDQPANSPAEDLPLYLPEESALFDDTISASLFKTSYLARDMPRDLHGPQRIERADAIWLMKVATVSRDGAEPAGLRYTVALRPLEALSGVLPEGQVTLTISATNPSFPWLNSVGGAWVGTELLLLTRHYREGKEATLHFHGEPNDDATRQQILGIVRAKRRQK
jgi:hypothetical protein